MSPEASLRAQHKSDIWGKEVSISKGQDWLSWDRGVLEAHCLLLERQAGSLGRGSCLTMKKENSKYTCSQRPCETLRSPAGQGGQKGN